MLFPDDVGVDALGVDEDFRFLLVLVGRLVSEWVEIKKFKMQTFRPN